MSEDLDSIKHILRQAVPPVAIESPRRDLWPDVRSRIAARRVAWFDWIVATAAVAATLALPAAAPILLYLL